ncbi:death ligand signal enhancer [Myxocyprinus asiaticus]|uniref:death ligand signal enhancer n=1 Tax=Myxocyprinus asiaticus TaxID=70543 RepID=UPI00222354EE|nr:death ligand signal enhancer [Myxocyprinus asiaticus]
MWRIHSLVSRVFSRCYGSAQLRLSQGHHVEDEVINSSILTAGRHASDSSSQRGEDENEKKKRTTKFSYTGLPRYTALDAVGWGAAVVLFMQVCRRIHSQFSTRADQNHGPAQIREAGPIHRCTYKVLIDILSRQDVLSKAVTVRCLREALQTPEQTDSSSSSDHSHSKHENSSDGHLIPDLQTAHTSRHQRVEAVSTLEETLFPEQPNQKETLSPEEAVQNLRQVADSSVPTILNIIGLESAKAGNYETAFSCFLASAQHNYSKAQFNVGVCFEKGRGVKRDHNKALQYYRRAAVAGHSQAQYRCAKLLLNSRGQQSSQTNTEEALSFLYAAADAGLTEAQVYLGVMLSEGSEVDERKCVHYFRKAAESGDSTALLFLAQCHERGFGVSQCIRTAVQLYHQAAERGNKHAKDILRERDRRDVLRSIQSSPCFSEIGQLNVNSMFPQVSGDVKPRPQQQSDWPTQMLPHSWSTGSLMTLPSITVQMLNVDTSHKVWTLGVR